ncbi:MAG: dihydropteroate synthase [Bacteroidaceae bacterium]
MEKNLFQLNLSGNLFSLETPQIMGIMNITPDSFYAGSRKQSELDIIQRTEEIIVQGGSLIDVGAYSSRPGAAEVSASEEMKRLKFALQIIKKNYPDVPLSVDTFRADVARMCVEEYGVDIINDISGGDLDPEMFHTIADLNVPYIMMHMKGTPQNMQQKIVYADFEQEVMAYFQEKIDRLLDMGLNDLILDPGFGFSKTLEQNYQMMNWLEDLQQFHLPILVGISRKSMIYNLLGCTANEALNGTSVLHTIAIQKGANILRVHDVKEAVETVKILEMLNNQDV